MTRMTCSKDAWYVRGVLASMHGYGARTTRAAWCAGQGCSFFKVSGPQSYLGPVLNLNYSMQHRQKSERPNKMNQK